MRNPEGMAVDYSRIVRAVKLIQTTKSEIRDLKSENRKHREINLETSELGKFFADANPRPHSSISLGKNGKTTKNAQNTKGEYFDLCAPCVLCG